MADPWDISKEERRELEDLPNVIGTGIGPKRVNGKPTDEIVLIVFVESKEAKEDLDESELVPDEIDGVPTDVQESGQITPDDDNVTQPQPPAPARGDRTRPFIGGVTVGHPQITSGSSSGVFIAEDDDIVILTNRHVASEADEDSTGDEFLQPGPSDGGVSPDDSIGTVKELGPWNVSGEPNLDAALISIDVEPYGGVLGHPDYGEPIEPRFDYRVVHPSKQTGLISGPIFAVDVISNVNYDFGTITHEGLIAYEPITEGGSSGTVNTLYDLERETFRPVGLHFASSDSRALMMPWQMLTDQFGHLEPAPNNGYPDLSSYSSYYECTILQNEIGPDGSLKALVANIGGDYSAPVRLKDVETNTVLEEKSIQSPPGDSQVVEFNPGLEAGEYRLSVYTPDVQETSDITVQEPAEEVKEEYPDGVESRPVVGIETEDLKAGTLGTPLEMTIGGSLAGNFGATRYWRRAGQSQTATFGGALPATFGSPLPATMGDKLDLTEPAVRDGGYALTLVGDERRVIDNAIGIDLSRKRSAVSTLTLTVGYEDEALADWRFSDVILTYDGRVIFRGELREVDPSPQSGVTDLVVYGPGLELDSGSLEVTFSGTRVTAAIQDFWDNYTNFAATVTERGHQTEDMTLISEETFTGTRLEILSELHEWGGMEFYVDPASDGRAYSFPRSRGNREVPIQPIGTGYDPSWDTTDYYNHVVVYGEENGNGERYRGEAFDQGEIDENGLKKWPEYTDLESDKECRDKARTLLQSYLSNNEQSGSIEMVPRTLNPGTALVIDKWDDERRVGPYSVYFNPGTNGVALPSDALDGFKSGALMMWVRADFGDPNTWPMLISAEYDSRSGSFNISDSQRLQLRIGGGTNAVSVSAYPDGPPTDEWTMLHYDWEYDPEVDRTTVRAGHDGVIESTGGFPGSFVAPDDYISLGQRNGNSYEGYIDDVRLYTGPLSAKKYRDLSNGDEVPGTDLRSRWSFNEGQLNRDNTTYDIVGGYHGLIGEGVEYRGNPLPIESIDYSENSGQFTMSVNLNHSDGWAEDLAQASKSIRSLTK